MAGSVIVTYIIAPYIYTGTLEIIASFTKEQ